MLTSFLLSMVLCGQAPPSAMELNSWRLESRISQSDRRKQEMIRTIELTKNRRIAKAKAKLEKEKHEAEESQKLNERQERAYRAAMPFIMESRRQQIDMMNAMQFNAALYQVAQSNIMLANSMRTRFYYPYFYTGGFIHYTPGTSVNIPQIISTHTMHAHHGK